MRDIILMLLLIILPIIQVVMLVKGIKYKRLGIAVFAVDVLSIVIAVSMMIYYESLPGYGFMPGLTYLIEELMSMAAFALYSLIMFITVSSKVIQFERQRKREGKTYANPLVLIVAFICLVGAATTFVYEKYENRNIISTFGTVTAFEEHAITYYTNGEHKDVTYQCPVITFKVNGEEYSDYTYPSEFDEEIELGDTVEIYCEPSDNGGYYITSPEDAKLVYLPTLVLGLILIIYRVVKSNRKPKKLNTESDGEKTAESGKE